MNLRVTEPLHLLLVIILISFLYFSGSAQPGRDTGDQTYPQGSDAERVFAQSCVSLWHPLICDLHSANESFKLGFFFYQ